MAHRPRPSRERARRQIERHADETGPAQPARPLTRFEQQLLDGTATVVTDIEPMATALYQEAPPVGEYRLSTRRPSSRPRPL
ncbi:hypothetical protein [Streptomyces sp. NBC_00557]|uniref:hypothetical protein n=1 Tax=Streptomyces sp. NBC_00557 TaxID=2975776 RepID=UPI002E817A90|nr:hypothetical protein [Streptomyces sp. NBC_00557]WUC39708.1 hypothetical protein OG956_38775 [Streptomyces sp. NBC_00557]